MKNLFFTDEQLQILLKPQNWRLIAEVISSDVKTVKDEILSKWCKKNHHSHSMTEILVCLSGDKNNYCCWNKIYPINPGSVFFFSKGSSHQNGYPSFYHEGVHLWIRVLQDFIGTFMVKIHSGSYNGRFLTNIHLDKNPEIAAAFENLNNLSEGHLPDQFIKMRLHSILTVIISSLVLLGYRRENEPVSKENFQKEVIMSIKEHLAHSLGKGENLDYLARLSGYSKYHFFRMFKQHTGCNIQEYIDYCRRKKTDEMLAEGATHKEISYQLGFSSPTSFSRWYKKHIRL